MPWLAVASAFVPGVPATTRALITSQTFTTVSSSGSRWRWRKSVADMSSIQPPVVNPAEGSFPEDALHDGMGTPGAAQVVVDHHVRPPGRVADRDRHRGPLPGVARQL